MFSIEKKLAERFYRTREAENKKLLKIALLKKHVCILENSCLMLIFRYNTIGFR